MNEKDQEILDSLVGIMDEAFPMTQETRKHLETVFGFAIQKTRADARKLINEFERRRSIE